jgi:DNA-binding XRE family transcriptional regulator
MSMTQPQDFDLEEAWLPEDEAERRFILAIMDGTLPHGDLIEVPADDEPAPDAKTRRRGGPSKLQTMTNLRALRESRGLTQRQLGGLAGLSRPAINLYESGKHKPRAMTAMRLADALGVTIFDLTRR